MRQCCSGAVLEEAEDEEAEQRHGGEADARLEEGHSVLGKTSLEKAAKKGF